MFLLSHFISTMICSSNSVSTTKSDLSLEQSFEFTRILTPPPILFGQVLWYPLKFGTMNLSTFFYFSHVSQTRTAPGVMVLFNRLFI